MATRSQIFFPYRQMGRFMAHLAFLFLLGGWAAAKELPRVKIGPPPAWVKPAAFEASDRAKAGDGGTRYYLQDQQVKADENVAYHHYAMEFLTKGAVEDESRITVSVNPAYQQLTFNTLLIHRDGKVLNRLPKQEIKLLQQESRLDWNMFDGRLSAMLILDDIRVGDIVEYAYTLKGANPIFGRHFMEEFYLQWSEPVELLKIRLLWPRGKYLGIQNHRIDTVPKITDLGKGVSEYVWERKNVPALLSDGELPSWYLPWGWVQLTDFKSWNEVAQWASAIYPRSRSIPPELAAELKQTAELKDRKAQVIRALHYVQDNIRYLGIEVGVNSHEPHPIEVVLERRFGDCKDKALLLSTMLRELGFEAYPALVSTDARDSIKDWLPSPLAFNHVVVQLVMDGRIYWMDPTRRNQGENLDQLYFPDYGRALVIRPETESLAKVEPSGFDVSSTKIAESFEFKDFSGAATLKVRTIYTGEEAERMRSYLSDMRRAEIQKNYLNFYSRQFPEIEAASPLRFEDDRAKNVVTSDEHYQIAKFWTPGEGEKKNRLAGEFFAASVRSSTQWPSATRRSMPMAMSHPIRLSQTIEARFPREMSLAKEDLKVEDPAFKFTYASRSVNERIIIRYDYETRADQVDPSDMATYLKKVESMRNVLSYEITIPVAWTKPESEAPEASPEVALDYRWMIACAFVVAFMILCCIGAGVFWWWLSRPPVVIPPAIPLHCCAVCGATEQDHSLDFRVAHDGHEYCTRHLRL